MGSRSLIYVDRATVFGRVLLDQLQWLACLRYRQVVLIQRIPRQVCRDVV